jgi:hypothetical protein
VNYYFGLVNMPIMIIVVKVKKKIIITGGAGTASTP